MLQQSVLTEHCQTMGFTCDNQASRHWPAMWMHSLWHQHSPDQQHLAAT